MKSKYLLLVVFLLAGFVAKANKAAMFTYDKAAVQSEMKCLDAVAAKHLETGNTLSEMKANHETALEGLSLSEKGFSSAATSDGPLGIPSFLWGCVFGVFGILFVYLITEDSYEARLALFGCLAWGVVGFFLFFLPIVFLGGFWF